MRLLVLLVCSITSGAIAQTAVDRIRIPAKINGKEVQLNFDTGAEHIFIYPKTAQRLELSVTTQSPDPNTVRGMVKPPITEECEVRTDLISLRTIIAVTDAPPISTEDGVFPWVFFVNYILKIDASQLDIGKSGITNLPSLPPDISKWTKVKIEPHQMVLRLDTGNNNFVLLDTGFPYGIMLDTQTPGWKLKGKHQATTIESGGFPAEGQFIAEEVWMDSFSIGDLLFKGVAVSQHDLSRASPNRSAAIIGIGALKRVDLIIDGPNLACYFKPKDTRPRIPIHNRFGALTWTNGLVVMPNTPAYEAGLRDGDILIDTEIQLPKELSEAERSFNDQLFFWHKPEGTKIRVTYKRRGTIGIATVVLRNILGPSSSSRKGWLVLVVATLFGFVALLLLRKSRIAAAARPQPAQK